MNSTPNATASLNSHHKALSQWLRRRSEQGWYSCWDFCFCYKMCEPLDCNGTLNCYKFAKWENKKLGLAQSHLKDAVINLLTVNIIFKGIYTHVFISKRFEKLKVVFFHLYIYFWNYVFVSSHPFLFILRAHILPRICIYRGQLFCLSCVTCRHPFSFNSSFVHSSFT
jgi:hypothetical protein